MIHAVTNGGVTTLTLDRPDKANALTEAMLRDLCGAVEEAQTSKVLILTGRGSVFSAGADLAAAKAGLAVSPLWERLSAGIAGFKGLSIAALNGTVAGGAFGMVLASDLRVAVPKAKFFYPVMKLGFLPPAPDPGRLVQLVGPARAKMILMAGQKVTSETALDWGLVDQVSEDVIAAAQALSEDAIGAANAHIAGIKSLL